MVKCSATIELEIEFESANVYVLEEDAGFVEEYSTIVTTPSSCPCNKENDMNCCSKNNAKTHSHSSEAANILGFKNTYLEQNGIKTSIVVDGGKLSKIASIIFIGKTKAELSVRMVSVF